MAEYKLTEEGKEYLKKGLPEKQLAVFLDSLPQKSASIGKLAVSIKNFPIALKWALERGWVMKKGNQITLMKPPHETEEETALSSIAKGKDVDERILKILLERNLVNRVTETFIKTEEKLKKSGNVIDELTHDLIRTGLWKKAKFKKIDLNERIAVKKMEKGKRQPYVEFLWEVREKLVELGFKEMVGPHIELEFWNFDALFQPQNHPARDWSMTFQLKNPKYGKLPDKKIVKNVKRAHEKGIAGSTGWQYKWDPRRAMMLMPRAHGTAVSARTLASKPKIPGKYFAMSRCYRPDVIDITHGVEFNQIEGIVVAEDLNFKSLLGILEMFAKEVAGAKKVRFSTSYFPFTEPSCEMSIKHPEIGWIESGGAGIFRKELTIPLGVNVPVLAWGLGVDRLAMIKLGINNIRELFSRDLRWLRGKVIP